MRKVRIVSSTLSRARASASYWAAFRVLLAAALFSSWLGCRPAADEPPEPVDLRVDLVEEMATADVRSTRDRLRLAEPSARSHLLRGFSFLEEDTTGPYIWATGELSEIEIFLVRPTEFELVVHGRPFRPEGAPEQGVTLEVNDSRVGSQPLKPTDDRFSFKIPKHHTRVGANRLGLRFAHTYKPAQWLEEARDDRALTLQVYSFEFLGLEPAEPPRRQALSAQGGNEAGVERPVEHAMELPVGSRVSWFVDVEPGEVLDLRPLSVQDGSADRLEATVRVSNPDGQVLEAVVEPGRGTRLELDELFAGGSGGEPSEDTRETGMVGRALKIELLSREHLSLARSLWQSLGGGHQVAGALRLRGGIGSIASTVAESSAPAADPSDSTAADPSETTALLSSPVSSPVSSPDILIYMIDTLRADRLGAYGSDLGLTPHIDRFAEDGVVFRQSRAQTSWTRTAVTSMMTGLYPQSHGVNDRDDGLIQEVVTLAEVLKDRGYQNVGVITNGNVGFRFGLGQGFSIYQHLRESRQRRDVHILSDQVDEWVGTWLTTLGSRPDRRDKTEHPPFFLYAHVTDPHAPYTPHEPFLSRFAGDARPGLGELHSVRAIDSREIEAGPVEAVELMALYNAEVAFTDEQFGKTVDRFKRLGLYDDMMILVVSDHGEEFFEHGDWEHGETLYEEQLRVPLILKLPGNQGAGQVLDVRAGHVDVMPTLLEVIGAAVPEDVDGKSLLPAIHGEDAEGGAMTLAFLALEKREKRSLVIDGLKLIGDNRSVDRLFDLENDPLELEDQAPERVFERGFMGQELRALEWELAARRRSAEQVEIDPELRKQLEALGYIQ